MNKTVTISKIDDLSDGLRQECYWIIAQTQPQLAENFYHMAGRNVARGHLLFVASLPTMVVGVLMGYVFECDGQKYAKIEYNFVDKKYRGMGIGGKMMDAYEKCAQNTHNVCRVYLKSTSGALPFYGRRGYAAVNGCYMSKSFGR